MPTYGEPEAKFMQNAYGQWITASEQDYRIKVKQQKNKFSTEKKTKYCFEVLSLTQQKEVQRSKTLGFHEHHHQWQPLYCIVYMAIAWGVCKPSLHM